MSIEAPGKLQGKMKVFLNEGGVVNIVFFVPIDKSEQMAAASFLKEAAEDLFSADPNRKFDVIIDNTAVGKGQSITMREARKALIRLASHKQVGKIAMLGSNQFYNFMASFVARAAGREFRVLSSRKEAIHWFEEGK